MHKKILFNFTLSLIISSFLTLSDVSAQTQLTCDSGVANQLTYWTAKGKIGSTNISYSPSTLDLGTTGVITANKYCFKNSTNCIDTNPGINPWSYHLNQKDIFLSTTGNVGIGVNAPTAKLEVNGYLKSKTGYLDRNMLDTNVWTVNTGSIGGFTANGTASENDRIWATDPLGRPGIIWRSINDSANDADGGWNYANIPISPNKAYRVSVWIKKDNTTSGRIYLGANGASTLNLNNTANTNPYFLSFLSSSLVANRWYLLVGYIHANNDNSMTSYSGVYDGITGQKILTGTDYKTSNTATVQTHRAYNYYDTTAGSIQYFANPRFEEIDGNEPTIESLIGVNQGATIASDSYFAGNVGIGTTAPGAKLDVNGDAYFGTTNKLKVQPYSDVISIQATSATNDATKKDIALNTWGGNVGIGTSTPGGYKLLVSDQSRDVLFDVNNVHIQNPEGTSNTVRLGSAWNKPGIYSNGNLYLGSEGSVVINDNNQENWVFDGAVVSTPGRMHINGGETLYILNRNGVIISNAWGGSGNLQVDGMIIQEVWQPITTITSTSSPWYNLDSGLTVKYNTAGYFKDKNGIVHLRGTIKYRPTTTPVSSVIGILPLSYRPEFRELQGSFASGPAMARIDIFPDGTIQYIGGPTAQPAVSLDGITFRAHH